MRSSLLVIAAAAPLLVQGQTRLAFESASVKPAPAPPGVAVEGGGIKMAAGSDAQRFRSTGGPGTSDPGRIHHPLVSLKALLNRAYDSYYEISGPAWLETDLLEVDATVPATTTPEQFREMLRNLITDRFHLESHAETRDVNGYALTVAKGGAKLKESTPPPVEAGADDAERPRRREIGPDGFPAPPAKIGPGFLYQTATGNRARMLGRAENLASLVRELGKLLDSIVVDETGMTSRYDITLSFAGSFGGPHGVRADLQSADLPDGAAPALPDILSAMQAQLGLKLERRKVPARILVVDRIEKIPEGN